MLPAAPQRLSTPDREFSPVIRVVLPEPRDTALVRTGLALAHGHRTRLRAVALHDPTAALPASLRLSLHGLTTGSPADRAIRHLVRSASRGAHVEVLPLASDAATARLQLGLDSPEGSELLVIGRVRGCRAPEAETIHGLLEQWAGPVLVLLDSDGPAFSEVLAVTPSDDAPIRDTFARHSHALEQSYPVYWKHDVRKPRALGKLSVEQRSVVVAQCRPVGVS